MGQLDGVKAIVAVFYRASLFLEVPVRVAASLECVSGN